MKDKRTQAHEQEEVQCLSKCGVPEAQVSLEIFLYCKSMLPKSLKMVKYNPNNHLPDQFRHLL